VRSAILALAAAAGLVAGCGGDDAITPPSPAASGSVAAIAVTSPVFTEGQTIPRDFTCRGSGAAPGVAWQGVPVAAASVALVVTDPDAGSGGFVHRVLYNLPPQDAQVPGKGTPAGAKEGDNSGGGPGWTAPCPPSGTHHYHFTVYALSAAPAGPSTQDVLDQIGRTTLARGELVGVVAAGQ
jgi:Raf kinase inhibitor-like YbhB/YbcL family protein